MTDQHRLPVNDTTTVATLWESPRKPKACYVLAHGAGAGMTHAFMQSVASALLERQIATLRFQFPYMEKGSRRTDSPKLCHATIRAAAKYAREKTDLPLIAGGRSFGGRMASQAQADEPLPDVVGLAFLGFPLHPPKVPSDERAVHLNRVKIPMLFLQGTRDELADLTLLKALVERLGQRATLKLYEDGDHSFHVRARSGRTDTEVFDTMMNDLAGWIDAICGN